MDYAELTPLIAVTKKLDAHSVQYTLGGSGLLYALGLVKHVDDWDLFTDQPKETVLTALKGLPLHEQASGDYPFASQYKLGIQLEHRELEIIGCFSIATANGVYALPSIVGFHWHGIALGSPEVWYIAYTLMGREEKADLLLNYLSKNGANLPIVKRLREANPPQKIAAVLQTLDK